MGGDASDTLQHLAGYGVGALSALTSIKGGGLQNFFLNRQRALADPAFRATLVGSPFTSGEFFQSGSDVAPAAPGTPIPATGSVVAPSDVLWAQQQSPTRRWVPNAPPLSAEQQVGVQAAQGIVSGLQSTDPVVRAQAKLSGKIPLTGEEQTAVIHAGQQLQGTLGQGSTVGVQVPGMPIQIGSPYNVAPLGEEEFPTPEQAIASSNAHGWGGRIGPTVHGGWKPIPPPSPSETLPPPPGTPPAVGTPPAKAPAGTQPAPAPAAGPVIRGTVRPGTPMVSPPPGPTAAAEPQFMAASTTIPNRTNNPGNIKDGTFARAQPGYVGAGPSAKDGGNFAVFDSPDSGLNAMSNLLTGPHYASLTVDGAANRWSNGGYGGEVGARVGIHPDRLISSLSNDERSALAGSIAQREGFTGGVPPAPAPRPQRQAPPVPPPPAAPVAPGGMFAPSTAYAAEVPPGATVQQPAAAFDREAVVPHVVVPPADTGEAGGAVGYPSGAPVVPAGPPPLITVRPPAAAAGAPVPATGGAPQMPAPAPVLPGIPTEPKSGQPLETETHQYTGGVTQTYHAPPRGSTDEQGLMRWAGITDMAQATPEQLQIYNGAKRFLAWQERMDSANIARISQAPSETEKRETDRLHFINSAVADLESDPRFDTPEKRAHYVGWMTYPTRMIEQKLNSEDAKTIADFRRKIAFLAPSTFEADARNALSGPDLQYLSPLALNPYDATQFEANLQGLREVSARQIAFHGYISGLARDNPAALDDPRTLQYFNDQYRQQAQQQQSAAPAPAAPPAQVTPQPAAPPPTASRPWAPTNTWAVQ